MTLISGNKFNLYTETHKLFCVMFIQNSGVVNFSEAKNKVSFDAAVIAWRLNSANQMDDFNVYAKNIRYRGACLHDLSANSQVQLF